MEHTAETQAFAGSVVSGKISEVQAFVGAGFDINAEIRDQRAALHLAISCSSLNMCEAVIELGADVSLQFPIPSKSDIGTYSPLHFAAEQKSPEKFQLLLDAGAYPNSKSWNSATPLHVLLQDTAASGSDWLQCIRLLLNAGADTNAPATGQTLARNVLDLARQFGDEKAIDVQSNLTPLHCAVLISAFIEKNIAVAARREGFHGARVIEMLLDHGADPCFTPANPPKHYLTPLQMAVKIGSVEDVQIMINNEKADATQKTVAGRSLRQLAGRPEIQAILNAERTSAIIAEACVGSQTASSDHVTLRASGPSVGAL